MTKFLKKKSIELLNKLGGFSFFFKIRKNLISNKKFLVFNFFLELLENLIIFQLNNINFFSISFNNVMYYKYKIIFTLLDFLCIKANCFFYGLTEKLFFIKKYINHFTTNGEIFFNFNSNLRKINLNEILNLFIFYPVLDIFFIILVSNKNYFFKNFIYKLYKLLFTFINHLSKKYNLTNIIFENKIIFISLSCTEFLKKIYLYLEKFGYFIHYKKKTIVICVKNTKLWKNSIFLGIEKKINILESSFLFVKKLFLFLKKFEKFIKLFLALCVNSLSYGGMGINIVGILHKIYYSLRFGIINYLSKYFKKPAVILLKNKNLNSNFLFYKKVKNRIVIVSNYIHKNISYNSFLNYKKKK